MTVDSSRISSLTLNRLSLYLRVLRELGEVDCPLAIDLAGPHLLERRFWGSRDPEGDRAQTMDELIYQTVVVGFIMLPLVIPEIIMGIALLVLANMGKIPLSLWTIGTGHMLLCVPFAMLVMISRLEGFDKSMEEAARDLGENAWMTFWRVTFPLLIPGILGGALFALYQWQNPSATETEAQPREIVVTTGPINGLASSISMRNGSCIPETSR